MPRIYIAGAFSEWRAVRNVQAAVQAAGWVLTHDWTASAQAQYEGAETADARAERKAHDAVRDLEGVRSSDAVLVLFTLPKYQYRGTLTELGAALAFGKPVFMVESAGEDAAYRQVAFAHHPSIRRFATTADALRALAELARDIPAAHG